MTTEISSPRFQTQGSNKNVLQQHHVQLRQSLNFQALHPYLNKYGLIPLDHQEDFIPALPPVTSNDQIDRLLVWLPRCGQPDYVHKFIQCLRESSDDAGDAHSELADVLQEHVEHHESDVPTCLNWQTMNGRLSPDSIVRSPMETDSSVTLLPLVDIKRKQPYITAVNKIGTKGRKCCSAKWVGCYMTLSLPLVLSLILLITLSQVPATDDIIHPQIAVRNDTVELQFNFPIWWLSAFTLNIESDEYCTGTLFTTVGTSCSALPTVVGYSHAFDYTEVYLLPGSAIHFIINRDINSSRPMWIFWDFRLYLHYQDHPDQFDCLNAPPNSFCFETGQHPGAFQYNVTKAGYFNIGCGGEYVLCYELGGIRWHFEQRSYSYGEIASRYSPVATLDVGPVTIQVSSPFNFQPLCVLLHIDADSCGQLPYGYLKGSHIRKREDILLFPAISIFIFIIFLTCLSFFHCRSRKSRIE